MSNSRRGLRRRELLGGGAAAAAFGLVSSACSSRPKPGPDPATPPKIAPKRILILGGTGFLGPKTIDVALARGHHVTIFNRGKREKLLPLTAEVEHLYGNRDPELPADDERGPDGKLLHPNASPRGLEQLAGKRWDVVIDNSGYYPRMVGASAQLLAPNVGQYIFISSISAYATNPASGGDETTAVATIADPKVETMGASFENYGALKALCEQAVEAALPGRATIVRPGFIVGPGDPTDRFTYWPVRIARGGEVLVPGGAEDPLQIIDVRDLAEWLVTLAERGTPGTFNATGPERPARWGQVVDSCAAAAKSSAALTWVPASWLSANGGDGVFPIWAPAEGETAGFHRWSNERAKAAGLTFRPVAETIEALLAWYPQEVERRVRVTKELEAAAKAKGTAPPPGDPSALRAGPSAERERELLAAWKARK